MTAGVAGGVAGAVDAKLMVFTCGGAFSSLRGEREVSARLGGRGNRESEKDEGVFSVSLEAGLLSNEGNDVVRRGERRDWDEVAAAIGAGAMGKGPRLAGCGLGSLFIGLNSRTLPVAL